MPPSYPSPPSITHRPALDRLRREMGAGGARHGVLAMDKAGVDACLPGGGLPLGALHEVEPGGPGSVTGNGAGAQAQQGAVAAGFIARLLGRLPDPRPCLWVAVRCDLYPPGLLAFGLDPARLVLARARDDAAVLAAMEAGLRGGGFAAVVGEAGRLGRLAARRLQLACLRHASTGFVLRRWPYGTPAHLPAEAPAAVTRWRIAPAASGGPWAPPRWRLELLHARGGTPGEWIVEAGESDASGIVRVVAELADPAPASQRRRLG